jgi:hypothetical protein
MRTAHLEARANTLAGGIIAVTSGERRVRRKGVGGGGMREEEALMGFRD